MIGAIFYVTFICSTSLTGYNVTTTNVIYNVQENQKLYQAETISINEVMILNNTVRDSIERYTGEHISVMSGDAKKRVKRRGGRGGRRGRRRGKKGKDRIGVSTNRNIRNGETSNLLYTNSNLYATVILLSIHVVFGLFIYLSHI